MRVLAHQEKFFQTDPLLVDLCEQRSDELGLFSELLNLSPTHDILKRVIHRGQLLQHGNRRCWYYGTRRSPEVRLLTGDRSSHRAGNAVFSAV